MQVIYYLQYYFTIETKPSFLGLDGILSPSNKASRLKQYVTALNGV